MGRMLSWGERRRRRQRNELRQRRRPGNLPCRGRSRRLVASSATGGANADGFVGGGQAGCNYQTGTLVLGLEGDFDYFRSNPKFSNNTNTLARRQRAFTVAQSVTTNYLATVRPRDRHRGGSKLRLHHRRRRLHRRRATPRATWTPIGGAGAASASKALGGLGRRRGLGIRLGRSLDVPGRISVRELPDDHCLGTITGPGGTNTLHGSTDLVVQVLRAGVNFKF